MQLLRYPPFLPFLFPRAELNAEREPAVQQGFWVLILAFFPNRFRFRIHQIQ